VESIENVSRKISNKYGGHGSLSLTTKFLWLKMKSPIIIYDSRARNALGAAPDNLADFYARWRKKFDVCEQQIRDACTSLSELHKYTRVPKTYIAKVTAHRWFRERVFDVYLWHSEENGTESDGD
jgi:hypothetical protein